MAWTTPTTRTTGTLITAAIWNTDLVDNIAYLKGQAGDVLFEDDIRPNADETQKSGLSTARWAEVHADKMYASHAKFAVHRYIREVIITWEDNVLNTYQVDDNVGGGGDIDNGGTGQIRCKVDDDVVGTCDLFNLAEVNNAKDTSFNVSRSPYFRFEFSLDHFDAATRLQIGFEDTPAAATSWTNNDNYAGIYWTGALWAAQNSNGSGSAAQTTVTAYFTEDQRHVVEILVVSGGDVYIFIDGVIRHTGSTLQPTGDLEWVIHFWSIAGGGAGDDSFVTLGEFVLQEDLA